MCDDENFMSFIIEDAQIGAIESRCRDYLDEGTFNNTICLDSGEYTDALELFAPPGGSLTIQKIIDEHQESDTIHLRRPAPDILPIVIRKIANDSDSYIIPSEILQMHEILRGAPSYILEAIICDINQHSVVFMRKLETNKWFYYQDKYTCEKLGADLNDSLTRILQSRSEVEQKRLIKSTHFLLSFIFNNAVKYIYKQH